jgi:hypothetical protein
MPPITPAATASCAGSARTDELCAKIAPETTSVNNTLRIVFTTSSISMVRIKRACD